MIAINRSTENDEEREYLRQLAAAPPSSTLAQQFMQYAMMVTHENEDSDEEVGEGIDTRYPHAENTNQTEHKNGGKLHEI